MKKVTIIVLVFCLVSPVLGLEIASRDDSGLSARVIKTHSCTAFSGNYYATYGVLMQWQEHNNLQHWHMMPPAKHVYSYLPSGAFSSSWVNADKHSMTVEIYQSGVGLLARRTCP